MGRSEVNLFGGLNETYACGENELSGAMNFSTRGFPALQTRSPRRKLYDLAGCNGMYHLNGILLVVGSSVQYVPDDTEKPTVILADAVSDSEKILIGMGTRVMIWPDAVSYDTETGTLTKLGAKWTQGNGVTCRVEPCDAGGKTYTFTKSGTSEPRSPKDGDVFLKTNSENPYAYTNVLEQYNAKTKKWAEIVLNRVKLTLPGLGEAFRNSDVVTLDGVPEAVEEDLAAGVGGEVELESIEGDSVIVTGTPQTESLYYYGSFSISETKTTWKSMDGAVTRSSDGGTLSVERRVPKLEYVTENDNRIWGCNSEENVIYACKLGDPTNWFSYRGIASDSYAVTVGSDGPFTGAATCLGYALFFKENTLHKLYGSWPSDYQIVSVQCRGVAQGASRSLCVLAEVLYYLSLDGVMAWDGSLPVKISGKLDAAKLANVRHAVGGGLDTRYYLHLRVPKGDTDEARLLVYDTERGIWHEEGANGWQMVSTGRQLYLWDGASVWAADPQREPDRDDPEAAGVEEGVRFEAVTGDIGLTMPDDKSIRGVTLRIDAMTKSRVKVELSCDGGPWSTVGETVVADHWTRVHLPFVPRRHDMIRLRISGSGQIAIRSIAFTLETSEGGRVQRALPRA